MLTAQTWVDDGLDNTKDSELRGLGTISLRMTQGRAKLLQKERATAALALDAAAAETNKREVDETHKKVMPPHGQPVLMSRFISRLSLGEHGSWLQETDG